MGKDKNCCSRCCSGCGKCCKKTAKCVGHCCCGFLGGFYGCTRRKAIINHEPGLLVLHVVPIIFSALTLISYLVDYRFLEGSSSNVAPDVLSRWYTFQKLSMGISSAVMAVLALNLCVRLHVVRDEFKKPCLCPHQITPTHNPLHLFFPSFPLVYLISQTLSVLILAGEIGAIITGCKFHHPSHNTSHPFTFLHVFSSSQQSKCFTKDCSTSSAQQSVLSSTASSLVLQRQPNPRQVGLRQTM